ncbi:MAG: hypothetical protein SAL07_15415 [Oscillatoria sp. PMC 1051.18]|nr:hypothetical protein [Oscillatoria sp. PMC 1050.18]MEC5031286.1 hypothetical protein [Oscillatoria sp. PMC 1051.18]
MTEIPENTLLKIQQHFHQLICQRSGIELDEKSLKLPGLNELLQSQDTKAWFPIPDMYGGFIYRLQTQGEEVKLITESWSRVVTGSGQRHEITAQGIYLVEQGFV